MSYQLKKRKEARAAAVAAAGGYTPDLPSSAPSSTPDAFHPVVPSRSTRQAHPDEIALLNVRRYDIGALEQTAQQMTQPVPVTQSLGSSQVPPRAQGSFHEALQARLENEPEVVQREIGVYKALLTRVGRDGPDQETLASIADLRRRTTMNRAYMAYLDAHPKTRATLERLYTAHISSL